LVIRRFARPHTFRVLKNPKGLRATFPVDILVKQPDGLWAALEKGDFFIQ
jgi:hypothetical protein